MRRTRYKSNYINDNLDMSNFYSVYDDDGKLIYVDEFGNTPADKMADLAEEKSRLDSIGNVYQTADRIISREDINVSVVHDKEMKDKARNDGRNVVLNAELIDELDSNTIAQAHGVNYHELAHILYSPRAGSASGQYVSSNKQKRAYNMLEEARIERLITAKYPATRLFLEANILEYALESKDMSELFTTFTGRRYLDIELRQRVANEFIKQHGAPLAQELNSIINEYSKLAFPNDFDKGMELIQRLTNIVGTDEMECPIPMPSHEGEHSERDVLKQGRPRKASEQKELQDKVNDGASEELTDGADGDNNNPSNDNKPSHGSSGTNNDEIKVKEKTYTETDTELAKLLSERLANIHKDKRVKDEVRDVRKAIITNGDTRDSVNDVNYYERTPSMGAITYARKFALELERLVRDSDPKWHKDMPSGRLNISRTMTPDINAIGRVFDKWDTGSENTDIEAVILLDNSGSMSYYMNEVCEKAWIIKRGIESIDGKVTIYNFHDFTERLYDSDEKAKPRSYRAISPRGWTNPSFGLLEAERILNNTKKPIKMLFIVTDGEWENADVCDSIITRLNDSGAITSVVYMGDYKHLQDKINYAHQSENSAKALKAITHNAKIFKAVTEPKHILELAVKLVKSKVGS